MASLQLLKFLLQNVFISHGKQRPGSRAEKDHEDIHMGFPRVTICRRAYKKVEIFH